MKRTGFTLLELMVSISILSVLSAAMFGFAASVGAATEVQSDKITATDEARQAMRTIVRQVRQSAGMSINWGALPGNQLQFRIAEDVDGNGLAVDQGVSLELSTLRTIAEDLNDANGDGVTAGQLIMTGGARPQVLCNGLQPGGGGIWFEQIGASVRVTVQTQSGGGSTERAMPGLMVAVITPRN